jgi:hypothetical protein
VISRIVTALEETPDLRLIETDAELPFPAIRIGGIVLIERGLSPEMRRRALLREIGPDHGGDHAPSAFLVA